MRRGFSDHCRLQFVVVAAYQTVKKKEIFYFLDLFGKLDVGVLFVKVVLKSVDFVFVYGG